MWMWIATLALLLAAFALGLVYLSFRAAEFGFVQRLARGRRKTARLLCLAFFALLTAALCLIWNVMNAVVCMIHLLAFWLLCDLIAALIARVRGGKPARTAAGAAAVVVCVLYLAWGWYAVHHVWETDYRFETEKLDGSVRIVQITDSHIGATFHANGLARHVRAINALAPDVVVVTGDFVDDDTSREDMLGGCDALGALQTKYGVYFVYGNHDKGYYSESSRGWTAAELRARLEENGVVILEDEAALIDGRFYVAGRQDRSEEQRGGSRATAAEVLSGLDRDKYIVLLDHQPAEFDAEAAAGADLVLCGHTHGGQFIPIGRVGEWIGENCRTYGHEKRQNTDFIVSSGISNWTFKFKTGCRSEYVVIDVAGRAG